MLRICRACKAAPAAEHHPECSPCHGDVLRTSAARLACGVRAIAKVRNEVRRGRLPKLDGTIACVDCGKPARTYDHRDYRKPLDVEPVCRSCNGKRGPALWSDNDPVSDS